MFCKLCSVCIYEEERGRAKRFNLVREAETETATKIQVDFLTDLPPPQTKKKEKRKRRKSSNSNRFPCYTDIQMTNKYQKYKPFEMGGGRIPLCLRAVGTSQLTPQPVHGMNFKGERCSQKCAVEL